MKTIAVLMGGPSSEHDVSLMTGNNVLRALAGRYHVVPIFVTHAGEWLVGKGRKWMTPVDALCNIDVAFNAMHGEYGEDGKIQRVLDVSGVPYTGSGSFSSALAMNKQRAGHLFREHGLKLPRSIAFRRNDYNEENIIRDALRLSAPPWVVKPVRRGSSVGVTIACTNRDLTPAFQKAFEYDDHAILQEYIKGRELTCAVLENFEGEQHYALPPIEIVPPENAQFFDYQVKYNGSTKEICPADFYGGMLQTIREAAVTAHQALNCRHYSRTDMILKGQTLYILEVNTLPGLTSESLFPKAARAAGIEFPYLLDHIVNLAMR